MKRLKTVLGAAVVGVVVVIAAVAASLQATGRDDSSGPTPGSTSAASPAATVVRTAAAATRTAAPGLAVATLSESERLGGHTLERHVGRSDAQLQQRLRDETDISAASSYPDLATAERAVAFVFEANASEVRQWLARSGSRANLALREDTGFTTGRSWGRGDARAADVTGAVVVLRWDDGAYILTSYPEEAR